MIEEKRKKQENEAIVCIGRKKGKKKKQENEVIEYIGC